MINGVSHVERTRGVRTIVGRVDVSAGTPSVGTGEGFSLVDVAPGQVKIVLTHPGRKILAAWANPLETTDGKSHACKVDAKTEASDVTFGIYVMGSGTTTTFAASNMTAATASSVTLSTSNTYSDAAVKLAIDSAVDALASKIKTNVDGAIDTATGLVATAVNAQDGALIDNVGFYFEITVQDVSV